MAGVRSSTEVRFGPDPRTSIRARGQHVPQREAGHTEAPGRMLRTVQRNACINGGVHTRLLARFWSAVILTHQGGGGGDGPGAVTAPARRPTSTRSGQNHPGPEPAPPDCQRRAPLPGRGGSSPPRAGRNPSVRTRAWSDCGTMRAKWTSRSDPRRRGRFTAPAGPSEARRPTRRVRTHAAPRHGRRSVHGASGSGYTLWASG